MFVLLVYQCILDLICTCVYHQLGPSACMMCSVFCIQTLTDGDEWADSDDDDNEDEEGKDEDKDKDDEGMPP